MAQAIVLISGANSGIGCKLAELLASTADKYHVLLGSRDVAKGEAAKAGFPAAAQKNTTVVQLDITDETSVEAVAKKIESTYGHLEVLVNNAGLLPELALMGKPAVEQFKAGFDVNIIGTARLTEAVLPLLRKSSASKPRVVSVSSSAASLGEKVKGPYLLHAPSYSASKAAVNAMTVTYAMQSKAEAEKDPAVKQIYFNAVCPGAVKTPMTMFTGEVEPEEGCKELLRLITGDSSETGTYTRHQGTIPF